MTVFGVDEKGEEVAVFVDELLRWIMSSESCRWDYS